MRLQTLDVRLLTLHYSLLIGYRSCCSCCFVLINRTAIAVESAIVFQFTLVRDRSDRAHSHLPGRRRGLLAPGYCFRPFRPFSKIAPEPIGGHPLSKSVTVCGRFCFNLEFSGWATDHDTCGYWISLRQRCNSIRAGQRPVVGKCGMAIALKGRKQRKKSYRFQVSGWSVKCYVPIRLTSSNIQKKPLIGFRTGIFLAYIIIVS